MRVPIVLLILVGAISGRLSAEELPRSRDPRLKIELFAEHPQIVTPTGIDVDHVGRVWAIESNTHFRPQDYKGHASDRLLVLSDTNGDGRADKIVTFADGFTHAMSVAVRPLWFREDSKPVPAQPKLSVYLATRREVLLLHDDDGDLHVDRTVVIAHLETKGVYPHNALNGLAFHPLGWLYFGMGENLGAAYKLIGSDGTTLAGGGEGGNMFRCRPDGSKLERIATGFWNPHASCFDAFGRLFSVDNDPDSRPPCRLLHVIPGGDYGFRYRNGRKGLHPFTSWNGEIPGTLPMVAGTGEAPGGIVAYESDGLADDYRGNLIVTSWGDHRIDRFRLQAKGASFTALAEPVIVGGENFRPVGLACAPDGSLYCTDWMLRDYNLHGHGRVWKISGKLSRDAEAVELPRIDSENSLSKLNDWLFSDRLEVRRLAARTLSRTRNGRASLVSGIGNTPERGVIEALYALGLVPRQVEDTRLFNTSTGRVTERLRTPSEWAVFLQLITGDTPQMSVRPDNDVFILDAAAAGLLESFALDNSELGDKKLLQITTEPLAALMAGDEVWLPLQFPVQVADKSKSQAYPSPALLEKWLKSDDVVMFATFVYAMSKCLNPHSAVMDPQVSKSKFPASRLLYLLSCRRRDPRQQAPLHWGLRDADARIRRAAIQWIAEEGLIGYRPQVAAMLNDPTISADMFLATLAALEMLDGVAPAEFDRTPPGKYVLPLVKDERRPAPVRALALRMVDPADPALTGALLEKLLATNDPVLRQEAVRTLQFSSLPEAPKLLRAIAVDEKQEINLRLEAIAGLAAALKKVDRDKPTEELLAGLAFEKKYPQSIRVEALRSLRGFSRHLKVQKDKEFLFATALEAEMRGQKEPLSAQKQELIDQFGLTFYESSERSVLLDELRTRLKLRRPQNRAEWQTALNINPDQKPAAGDQKSSVGDAASGRRVFYHVNAAGCYKCHTVNGRGGKIGPDLSTIGRSFTREKLLDSILEPGKEIAPQFINWSFETRQGKTITGMIVHENEGRTVVGDPDGKLTELKTIDVVDRTPLKASVMPEKLLDRLTVQEVRDMLAFLESLR